MDRGYCVIDIYSSHIRQSFGCHSVFDLVNLRLIFDLCSLEACAAVDDLVDIHCPFGKTNEQSIIYRVSVVLSTNTTLKSKQFCIA